MNEATMYFMNNIIYQLEQIKLQVQHCEQQLDFYKRSKNNFIYEFIRTYQSDDYTRKLVKSLDNLIHCQSPKTERKIRETIILDDFFSPMLTQEYLDKIEWEFDKLEVIHPDILSIYRLPFIIRGKKKGQLYRFFFSITDPNTIHLEYLIKNGLNHNNDIGITISKIEFLDNDYCQQEDLFNSLDYMSVGKYIREVLIPGVEKTTEK